MGKLSLLKDLTPMSQALMLHYPVHAGSGHILYDQTKKMNGTIYGGVRWLEVSNNYSLLINKQSLADSIPTAIPFS